MTQAQSKAEVEQEHYDLNSILHNGGNAAYMAKYSCRKKNNRDRQQRLRCLFKLPW